MATYPIKMLKDENNNPFVPLVSTECVKDPGGQSLDQKLATKLETSNILAGDNTISVSTSGNNVSITANLPAGSTLIDNTTTSTAGQGALDAHQGKVLRDSIPVIVDDVTDTSATKALSANQGYVLNQKFSDYVLTTALENLVKQYILASHPIGSIEINITGTNPSNYLGGTWVAWGTGQVPVGVDTTQTEFNTVEKSGGNKNHTHTISHTHGVPGVKHTHTISHTHDVPGVAHQHSLSDAGWAKMSMHGTGKICYHELSIGSANAYTSTFYVQGSSGGSESETDQWGAGLGGKTDSATPGAATTNSQSTTTSGETTPSATTTNSQSTTDSGSTSTLQPYITCYMWKRTA